MSDQDLILLTTKLHRPNLPKDLVTRRRLIDLLNHDIDRPLILICAPAGFGKTTLVCNWLKQMEVAQTSTSINLPAAWLSLDENDNDLNYFIHYFIAALRAIFNGCCAETLAILHARQQVPTSVLYATLINELVKLPGEAILVLDDYHSIHKAEVHNLLAEMVHHWPKPLHLVLISRLSPPVSLDRLRAGGMLCEIRTRDLRFKPEETAAYLGQVQAAHLKPEVLHLLEEKFEGWPAGLHLASLSLRSEESQETILSELSGSNPNITGYLVDEVLTRQYPAIHTFLLKTSILDRFCVGLCEAVIGDFDPAWNARRCLDWIERSELFIIPLDNRQEWYRYHHLFQELLQHRLSTEIESNEVSNLHRRASAWCNEHGLIDEALHHALKAGDMDMAAHQISAGLRDVLNREDRPTLDRWLCLLPEELIQQRPDLLILKLWMFQFSWRLTLQAQLVRQVESLLDSEAGASLLPNEQQILRGQILMPKAQQAFFSNQPLLSIDICNQVLALLPVSWTFVRGGAMFYLGMSMQASGQAGAAEQMLLSGYEDCEDKTTIYALFHLLSLGFNYLHVGQLEQTTQIAQLLHQGSARSRIVIMKNWADRFLGVVCYQHNDLVAATQHFAQIVENRYTAQISAYRDAVAGLTLIHQMKGESSAACEMVESISKYDLEQRGSEDDRTRSLRARLMLLQGDLEGAYRWVETFTDPPPDQALMWLEEPQLTRARILLAKGAVSDLSLALQVLDALEEISDRTHNTYFKIEILALRALALDAQRKTLEAQAALKQSLHLSRSGGFIRVFVDLGIPMQKMLHQIVKNDDSVEPIRRILAAFHEENKNLARGESLSRLAQYPSPARSILIEPLTPRELEVLGLLKEPLSIKEIALKLNTSYATTRRHTINIYAKLGVNRRWDAVTRAQELNIFPSH